jgi:hypothetical protein
LLDFTISKTVIPELLVIEGVDSPDIARGLVLVNGVASTSGQRVVALLISLPRDTGRLEDIDQAVLGGVVIAIIEDTSCSGASDHGDVVGLGRVGGT